MEQRQRRRYIACDNAGGLAAWAGEGLRFLSHVSTTFGCFPAVLMLALFVVVAPFWWLGQELWALLEAREKPRGQPRPKPVRGGTREEA